MASRTWFFLYGLSISAAEEFLTQGLLRDAYVSWIFTLIPFAIFLTLAYYLRKIIHRYKREWIAILLYYVTMGSVGIAVEWFIIGLAPWRDRTSPLMLVVLFHIGMFSFWGTVALGPHILLDDRVAFAKIRRTFAKTLVSFLSCTYVMAVTARLLGASAAIQFLFTVGPIILAFLSMNGIYAWYFANCQRLCRTSFRRKGSDPTWP